MTEKDHLMVDSYPRSGPIWRVCFEEGRKKGEERISWERWFWFWSHWRRVGTEYGRAQTCCDVKGQTWILARILYNK